MTPRVLMMGEYVPSGDEALPVRICETHQAVYLGDAGCHRCNVLGLPVEEQEEAAQQAIREDIRHEQALVVWLLVAWLCTMAGVASGVWCWLHR